MLGFSHITWPLSEMIEGGVKVMFSCTESQQKEFIELKYSLCYTPVLTLLDLKQAFETEIDSSDYAIGVVLT